MSAKPAVKQVLSIAVSQLSNNGGQFEVRVENISNNSWAKVADFLNIAAPWFQRKPYKQYKANFID